VDETLDEVDNSVALTTTFAGVANETAEVKEVETSDEVDS